MLNPILNDMGAPKGNQFWMLRSKHGRDKLFKTPELMWEAACEYFQHVLDNPIMKVEQTKGQLKGVLDDLTGETAPVNNLTYIPATAPFTMARLCLYLDCSVQYFSEFKRTLKPADKDFAVVIARIEQIIYTQKFEGAAIGAYNANLIAQELGLHKHLDIEMNVNTEITVVDQQTKDNLNKLINGND